MFDKEEVVIKREISDWVVYATDERASITTNSLYRFSTEEEALDNFIKGISKNSRM